MDLPASRPPLPALAPRSRATTPRAMTTVSTAGLGHAPSYGAHPFGFEKEFWLSAKTPLTDATPIATVNRFCIDHGFYMWELGGSTAHEQRRALYKLLEKHRWPEGLDGFMAAMKAPRASKPALNTAAPTMPHSAECEAIACARLSACPRAARRRRWRSRGGWRPRGICARRQPSSSVTNLG